MRIGVAVIALIIAGCAADQSCPLETVNGVAIMLFHRDGSPAALPPGDYTFVARADGQVLTLAMSTAPHTRACATATGTCQIEADTGAERVFLAAQPSGAGIGYRPPGRGGPSLVELAIWSGSDQKREPLARGTFVPDYVTGPAEDGCTPNVLATATLTLPAP